MRGRLSGTPEYRKAAEYVAAKFKEYGLQPAGDKGTWFQEVEIKDFRDYLPAYASRDYRTPAAHLFRGLGTRFPAG